MNTCVRVIYYSYIYSNIVIYIMYLSSKVKKNMSECCIWFHKESFFSFHILVVNAFQNFNAWDFLFTSKLLWFVLPNAKTCITSPGLRRLFDAWSEVKSNFLETKSPRSIQRLWSTTQTKLYNLRVSVLLSHLRKTTLSLIFNLPNAPSVTNLSRLFL